MLTNREGLFRTHLQRICSFSQKFQKGVFSKKCDVHCKKHVKVKQVLKTKMVPTVHTNIFYELDLEISEPNKESSGMEINWNCHFISFSFRA